MIGQTCLFDFELFKNGRFAGLPSPSLLLKCCFLENSVLTALLKGL